MNFIKSKIFLNKSIDVYFSTSGCLYVSGPLGVLSNKLFFRLILKITKLIVPLKILRLDIYFHFLSLEFLLLLWVIIFL